MQRPQFRIHPATASRWEDLEELFGERGACGGCWCMYLRLSGRQWDAGKGSGNKRAFRRLVTTSQRPGVLGYLGRRAIAWCAVAPRTEYTRLARSRVLKPVDDREVWSITCLFVHKEHRRMGFSVRMLRGAAEYAASRGARIVEGYPVEPTMQRTPDAFVWPGVPSAFRKAGFREVARRSRTRPIFRRAFRRSRPRR